MQARGRGNYSKVTKNGAGADKFAESVDASDKRKLRYNRALHVGHTSG